MITRRGIGIIIGAVAIFFLASVTRVGWLHLADAMLWGMIAIGAAVPWLTVPRLRATRRVETGVDPGAVTPVVGDEVEIQVAVENRGPLPRFLVSASYRSTLAGDRDGSQRIFFSHLPGRAATTGRNSIACDVRGRHEIGKLTLDSAAPFGLFRRRIAVDAPFSLLIYPRWLPMSRVGLLDAPRGEAEGRRLARLGVEIASSRRYGAGDPMRDVHWRNTARTGRLMVKEYDSGVEEGVVIAFDAATPVGEGAESTLEYAISIAASASRALVRGNQEVSIAAGGPPGPPTTDWRSIMETLALVRPAPRDRLGNAIALMPTTARLFVIVAADDRVSVSALASFARRGGSAAAVVLGGFDQSDRSQDPGPAMAALSEAGVAVTPCGPGGLESCIRGVESGAAAIRPARRAQMRRATAVPGGLGRAA